MKLLVREPTSTQLRTFVERLWYCESPTAAGHELVAPTGLPQIVVPFAEHASAPVLAGVFTAPQPIDASDQRQACGVVFRPGCSGAFIRAPLAEFTDQQPALDDGVWEGSPHIAEQLADARGAQVVFETLERLLLEALVDEWSPEATLLAGAQMLDSGAAVANVVSELDVDRRRFGRDFTQVLGVGPKHFARIRRFQRALRVVRTSGQVPLGQLAAELGYSDQAHMTRDFRAFSGATPSKVHGEETASPGHFVDD